MKPDLFDRLPAKTRRSWHKEAHSGLLFADFFDLLTEAECDHRDANTLAFERIINNNRLFYIPGGRYYVEERL